MDNSTSTTTEKPPDTSGSNFLPPPRRDQALDVIPVPKDPDAIPGVDFTFHWGKLCVYALFLLFCNLLFPCLIYYLVKIYGKRIDLRTNIGISSASLGISSCFDAPYRLFKLVKHRRIYGPLHDDVWWHTDFFMWTYTFALFIFAFPLAIAPATNPVSIDFFLMSTALLVLPFGLVFLITLFSFKLPVWCSSDGPGTRIKPAVFYIIEDLGAVDFGHGRAFRAKLHERWRVSPPFQYLMKILTIYWTIMTVVYFGITAAVTWTTPLDFAFAWVLGQLFLWAAVGAAGNWAITRWGLARERKWWDEERHNI